MLQFQFSVFPEIQTERLLLRRFTLEDAPALFYLKSNKEILKYLDKAPQKNIAEAEAFIKELFELQDKNENVLWAIAIKENPSTLIGYIGYWRMIYSHYRAEIGYTLHHGFWRKGIMDEALKAAIKYAFETIKLHSIEANINPANTASQALLEKNGFVREGYFKENYYYDGVFSDSAIYSLVDKK